MKADLGELMQAAEELKLATLRAKEMSIICYLSWSDGHDTFSIFSEDVFKDIASKADVVNRGVVENSVDSEYTYQYSVEYEGYTFTHLSNKFMVMTE